MNGGIGWNLSTLVVDRDPWEFYLMFLFREKLILNGVKFIRKSIYINFCEKIVGLNRSYLANTQYYIPSFIFPLQSL